MSFSCNRSPTEGDQFLWAISTITCTNNLWLRSWSLLISLSVCPLDGPLGFHFCLYKTEIIVPQSLEAVQLQGLMLEAHACGEALKLLSVFTYCPNRAWDFALKAQNDPSMDDFFLHCIVARTMSNISTPETCPNQHWSERWSIVLSWHQEEEEWMISAFILPDGAWLVSVSFNKTL